MPARTPPSRLPALACRLAGLVLLLAAGALPVAAAPAPASAPRAGLSEACRADLKRLCADVTPGSGRIAACLKGKRDQLSPACKADLAGRAGGGRPAPR